MISTKMAAVTVAATMESLALPQDLYWDGKMDSIPLPSSELFSIYDSIYGDLLSADVQADDSTINSNGDFTLTCNNNKLNHDFHAHNKDFTEACDFNEANLFASLPSPLNSSTDDDKVFHITHITPNYTTYDYTQTKPVHNQLTPPSSPSQTEHPTAVQSSLFLQPVKAATTAATAASPAAVATFSNFDNDVFNDISSGNINTSRELCSSKLIDNTNWQLLSNTITTDVEPPLCDDDLAREIQIVDDILKLAANELFVEQNTPPGSSVAASLKDGYSSFSDDDYDYDIEDDLIAGNEWLQKSTTNENCEITSNHLDMGIRKKRSKSLYGRGSEDRKIRKKEQNKNAATRYRQKKKLEMECILIEEQGLLKRNVELKNQYRENKREATYLKKLIREFYQHKHS